MVHRPSDSRLLINLISHEKDYSKQLGSLLEQSQASLASFSAYASASAPPASQIIIQVAGTLAGADEGLRKYAASLEVWQQQLKSVKDLEDEVGNVMRDREILVTRLIKASKSQKSTRDSILGTSGSSSTLNFTKPEVQIGSKLAAAQGELQACEAHLASKERELDALRTHAVRTGLQARCKALVECGWHWGEMGKEGLRALESLQVPNGVNGYGHPSGPLPYNKPLPDSGNSDLSSIGPSQSASQNTHLTTEIPSPPRPYTLHIPPAHSISDLGFPNGTIAPLARVDEGGGSSADEEEGRLEVRENERFSLNRGKSQRKDHSPSKSAFPASVSAPQVVTRSKPRQRQNSGMFGSIAAFFHHKGSSAGSDDERAPYGSEPYASTKSGSRWKSRTDKNLARRNSSDDERPSFTYPRTLPPDPISTGQLAPTTDSSTSASSQRLKKRTSKRNTMQGAPKTSALTSVAEDRGWASDNPIPAQKSGTLKAKKKTKQQAKPSAATAPATSGPGTKNKKGKEVEILHIVDEKKAPAAPSSPALSRGKKANGITLSAGLPTEVSLSRNSSTSRHSITSAASAPVNLSHSTTIHFAPALPHRSRSSHQRSASLDAGHPRHTAEGKATPKRTGAAAVYPTTRTGGEASLMSIVEGVATRNREHAQQQDPNRMLFVAKAPPPVSISVELEAAGASIVRPPPPPAKMEREASERSVPLTPSIPPPQVPVLHQPSSPEMKPLRSAMRNSSRSPSPPRPLKLAIAPIPLARPPLRSAARTLDAPDDGDDVASISSYETTRETLDDEELKTPVQAQTPRFAVPPATPSLPPAVPPKPVSPSANGNSNGSEASQSTESSTAGPTRRKSVRMSLPPTFSPTPPAVDDTDETMVRRFEPWSSPVYSGGEWASRIREGRDVWQDSSEDEDEDYSAAKKLLSKFGRRR
ncbi:hypothetical protein PHLGIDRAFT_37817 [Phlebiopsis gigantea 11061_1 CR5-6]|uniref:Uncharacterized protein n=1 Tax=Phlebiopsis gigantea (strain 11061_1 CR5-6) TaxID=745531 RepID=A0A0C3PC35_PHLG1|nr:hypothetical protein PHLGIDRAFT_37817 [Phlebiopsis gigantea 11061_1 CR5-6]